MLIDLARLYHLRALLRTKLRVFKTLQLGNTLDSILLGTTGETDHVD